MLQNQEIRSVQILWLLCTWAKKWRSTPTPHSITERLAILTRGQPFEEMVRGIMGVLPTCKKSDRMDPDETIYMAATIAAMAIAHPSNPKLGLLLTTLWSVIGEPETNSLFNEACVIGLLQAAAMLGNHQDIGWPERIHDVDHAFEKRIWRIIMKAAANAAVTTESLSGNHSFRYGGELAGAMSAYLATHSKNSPLAIARRAHIRDAIRTTDLDALNECRKPQSLMRELSSQMAFSTFNSLSTSVQFKLLSQKQ
ncbi:MAG: hypothetical protein Q7R63_00495 [bacterium]|nr:hypothetical protein [bacterium]